MQVKVSLGTERHSRSTEWCFRKQEDRITAEAGGHLWRSSRITPCSEQGQTPQVPSISAGCWRSLWMKTPVSLDNLFHCLIILSKIIFLHPYRIGWVSVCAHSFWSFSGHHWAEPDLHLFYSLPSQVLTHTGKIPWAFSSPGWIAP